MAKLFVFESVVRYQGNQVSYMLLASGVDTGKFIDHMYLLLLMLTRGTVILPEQLKYLRATRLFIHMRRSEGKL
jgi:hypothetical protein